MLNDDIRTLMAQEWLTLEMAADEDGDTLTERERQLWEAGIMTGLRLRIERIVAEPRPRH